MDIYEQLKRDEGLELHAYRDSVGKMTIGYGHNLDATGEAVPDSITVEQANEYLAADVTKASENLSRLLPWTDNLDDARRGVLLNMTFNMGIGGLLGFHRTLTMIEAGNYEGAAEAMLQSKWATQVGVRAHRLSVQMETGIWT